MSILSAPTATSQANLHTTEVITREKLPLKKDYYFPYTDVYSGYILLITSNKAALSINDPSHLYTLNDDVLDFAQKHNLLQYFSETFNRINTFFPKSRTEIELIEDIEEGYFTIFIRILTSLSVKEAFEHQKNMFKEWELLKNKNFNQYINISTRFV